MSRPARLAPLTMLLAFSACSGAPSGAGAEVPPVPAERLASAVAVERGRGLFREHCVLCHGIAGDGRGVRRSAMRTPPRDLTNPRWQRQIAPAQLFRTIRDGVPGSQMPAWRTFDEGQIWDLVAYVRQLSGGRR